MTGKTASGARPAPFNPGDRVVWNGGAGTFLRYGIDKKGRAIGVLKWDEDKDNDIEQDDDIEEIRPLVPLTIDEVATATAPGATPPHSPWGYVITADGTVYALHYQWYHGIVCAILFPDMAEAAGYAPPARDAANVYHYQRFELDHQQDLPVVRIAFGMMTACNVSKGKQAATPAQVAGTRRALLARGIGLYDTICGQLCDMSMRELLQWLTKGDHDDEA